MRRLQFHILIQLLIIKVLVLNELLLVLDFLRLLSLLSSKVVLHYCVLLGEDVDGGHSLIPFKLLILLVQQIGGLGLLVCAFLEAGAVAHNISRLCLLHLLFPHLLHVLGTFLARFEREGVEGEGIVAGSGLANLKLIKAYQLLLGHREASVVTLVLIKRLKRLFLAGNFYRCDILLGNGRQIKQTVLFIVEISSIVLKRRSARRMILVVRGATLIQSFTWTFEQSFLAFGWTLEPFCVGIILLDF